MVKKFEVNGKTYVARPMDFGTIVALEEYGVSLDNLSEKPMSCVSGYLAICGNMTKVEAIAEIQAHVVGGGKLTDISNAITEMITESDFFLGLKNQGVEAETQPSEKKTAKKKAED